MTDLTEEIISQLKDFLLIEFPKKVIDITRPVYEKIRQFKERELYGTCKSNAFLIAQVFKLFGFNAEAKCVRMFVMNPEGQKLAKKSINALIKKVERERKHNQRKIWTLGIGFTKNESDAHAIVYFPNEYMILDNTFKQCERPEHNLIAENYWERIDKIPSSIYHSHIYPIEGDLEKYHSFGFLPQKVIAGGLSIQPQYSDLVKWTLERFSECLKIQVDIEKYRKKILKKARNSNRGVIYNTEVGILDQSKIN